MPDKNPIQHTPAHIKDGRNARHPAATSFAPLQPAAGVVADDVPAEQNPAGGPKASEAEGVIKPKREAEEVEAEVEVEEATAAPGEKRTTRRKS